MFNIAGAGVEYAINDNWSLKTEYLYTDLGKWTVDTGDAVYKNKFNIHTIRAGINFRF